MRVIFQYLPPNADAPEEITISDVGIDNVTHIPNKGDYVLLTQTYPEDKRNYPRKFIVVSRHFSFLNETEFDAVTLVVSDYEDSPATRPRE